MTQFYCTNRTCERRGECKTAQQFRTDKRMIQGAGFSAAPCPDFIKLNSNDMTSPLPLPQPRSLWRYKYNRRAIYEVDSCDGYDVLYRVRDDSEKRLFRKGLKAWIEQYEELPIDDALAELGGIF